MAEQRSYTGSFNNRWKFTGKELDEETGLYYFGARFYNPVTSLWLSVDPLAEKYPNISPYAYVANNPINAIDPDGRKIIFIVGGKKFTYRNGNFWHENGKRYNPAKESVSKTMYKILAAYRVIEKSDKILLKKMLKTLEESKTIHTVKEGGYYSNNVIGIQTGSIEERRVKYDGKSVSTLTEYNFHKDHISDSNTELPTVVHEMTHQYDFEIGNMSDNLEGNSAEDPAEIRAVHCENIAREIDGSKKRTEYGGVKIDEKKLKNPQNLDNNKVKKINQNKKINE